MNLAEIKSPEDIKKLSQKEIYQLIKEIRTTIIETVGQNGGHLASNLGVVELTVALHRVFNSPKDAIIWDVSHQCYTHKLLTGRYSEFSTLRQNKGITGFTNTSESEHDFFISGHASTSISSALGLLTARRLQGKTGKVIAVIGDGALTGGMAFEALSHGGQLADNLIVILNDNQMSIDHNTGSISRYLSRLTMSKSYQSFRTNIGSLKKILPFKGRHVAKFIYRFKRSLKGLFFTNNLFTDLGFQYVGPLDGHNEVSLENVLKRVSHIRGPVVVHVVTKKGKGYKPAEENPGQFHGVGPFNKVCDTSEIKKSKTFTEVFSDLMIEYGERYPQLAGITAAMAQGTGLSEFSKKYPERFFDVGIAEEHAVTFAGGLAKGGMIPVTAIYSTFMQRSVDQLIHDISLQNVHGIFVLDRAGPVPGDGVTHQGIFDISLLRGIPDIKMLSPATEWDFHACFDFAVRSEKSVVIRYPKNACPEDRNEFKEKSQLGQGILIKNLKGEKISESEKALIVCTGGMYSESLYAQKILEKENLISDIYSLRFIKPFDFEYFYNIAEKYKGIVFIEDGIITGSISCSIYEQLLINNYRNFKTGAFQEKYYPQGTRKEILQQAGIAPENIAAMVKEVLNA